MGLFGLFGNKNAIEKHGPRVANKRAQAPDRWESIQVLGKIATGAAPGEPQQAVAALLPRFTFYVDPSITDGEEKEEAFRCICEAGERALEPVRAAMRSHESLSWPLKILERLLPEALVVEEMIAVLRTMDTEYARDPQRKLQLLSSLEHKKDPAIAAAVAPFFTDVNESARFHAAGAALAQDDPSQIVPELARALAEEDSVRVKTRVLDALSERGLSLGAKPEGITLPEGYFLDAKGVPKKSPKKGGPNAKA